MTTNINPDMTIVDLTIHLQSNDWGQDDINEFVAEFGTMTRPEDEWEHCIQVFTTRVGTTYSLTEGILVWMLAQPTNTDETNVIPSLRAAQARVAKTMTWKVADVDWNQQLSEEAIDDIIGMTFGR
jgi:hypothetical protein